MPSAARLPNTSLNDPPLRAELYGVDQLKRHARELAQMHQLVTRQTPDKLISRLDENEIILAETYDLVLIAVEKDRRIAPAAEWLLDNFYLIEEQIHSARRHLPRSYSRELPCLANGMSANDPRVHGIALELIAHVDGRVDAASLSGFIASYQSATPLKLGELWAVPIMLHLALIENLRRVAVRLATGRRDRDSALDWAEKMLRVVEQNPTELVLVLADMGESDRAWDLFSLINPIHHGDTPQHQSTYHVEPYVVAADVYAVPPHTGRGGWTWYTGSAGWMYRLITESLPGLHLNVDKLRFSPLFPAAWHSFKIHYRYRNTFYHIDIHNTGTGTMVKWLSVDDVEQAEKVLQLVDDGNDQNVELEID